jgi:phosphopantothenoylcysteine synthetase/decarboxylase
MTGPVVYEIHVQDVLDEKWKDHFNPFRLTFRENGTLISGIARDQAELFGVLLKIRDGGFTLLSINRAFNLNGP